MYVPSKAAVSTEQAEGDKARTRIEGIIDPG
jgi:hypothetical protein